MLHFGINTSQVIHIFIYAISSEEVNKIEAKVEDWAAAITINAMAAITVMIIFIKMLDTFELEIL